MVVPTRLGSASCASGTKATPSGKSDATCAAASSASRVLPTPPGPVRVSKRASDLRIAEQIELTSCSPPMKAVGEVGKPGDTGTSVWIGSGSVEMDWNTTP